MADREVCIFVREEDTLVWSMPVWIICASKNIQVRLIKSEQVVSSALQERRHLAPLVKIDEFIVSELISIFETINEIYLNHRIWPNKSIERAAARDICGEVVRVCSGASPFVLNLGRSRICVDLDLMERIASLSQVAIQDSNDSALFGEFCAADAAASLLFLTGVSGVHSPEISKYLDMTINSTVVGEWLGNQPVAERREHFSKLINRRNRS